MRREEKNKINEIDYGFSRADLKMKIQGLTY